MGIKANSVKQLVDKAKTLVFDTKIKEGAARNIVNNRLKELEDKYKTLTSERSKKQIDNAKKTIIDKFKQQYNKEFYLPVVPRRTQKPNNSKNKSQTSPSSTTFQLKPNFFSPTQPSIRLPKSFVERQLAVDNLKLDFYTPWARPRNIQPGRTTRETIYQEQVKQPVRENVEVERQKQPIEQPIKAPVNASAPPLDINSVQRQSTKNKGLRLAARNRLFLNKYGDDLLKGIKWGAGLGVVGGGIDGIWRAAANTYRVMQDRESRQQNVVNTPVKSTNTNQQRISSNNQSDSTQSSTQNTSQTNTTPAQNNTSNTSQTNKSTQKNTSRTTQTNTSNRNTRTNSNRQSQSKAKNTSNSKSNTASRKKLISKEQAKKVFADEFKKAYQNVTIDAANTSTRDYYSEALSMKSQQDKQRKDEVAKLQQQVQSLQNQLNQLTNPIY